jgi:hypothetical protein
MYHPCHYLSPPPPSFANMAISTCNPPHKQLLMGLGAGASLSSLWCCHCVVFIVIVSSSSLSPPLTIVQPLVHPPSTQRAVARQHGGGCSIECCCRPFLPLPLPLPLPVPHHLSLVTVVIRRPPLFIVCHCLLLSVVVHCLSLFIVPPIVCCPPVVCCPLLFVVPPLFIVCHHSHPLVCHSSPALPCCPTHEPPHEQLLVGVGVGAVLSMVGGCCSCSLLSSRIRISRYQ